MPPNTRKKSSSDNGVANFNTTHWSVVLAAGDCAAPDAREALAELCRIYWVPLYAYARRRGTNVAEAQDLTQEFFARLLEKQSLAAADPERGKFRAFLLTSFKNFIANEWEKGSAKKRGGGQDLIPLDVAVGESRYGIEPTDELTPERVFDRQWVTALLDHVLNQLREEYLKAGKENYFNCLKEFITSQAEAASYAEVALELKMTEGAVRVAALRLRRRYRGLLRAEIAQTVLDPAEVDDEIRNLFAVLGKD